MTLWEWIQAILKVGITWLVNQPVVKKGIQVAQPPASTPKQATKTDASPDDTSDTLSIKQRQREAQRRQEAVQAKATQFDKDVSNLPKRKPEITRDEDRPVPKDDTPAVQIVEPIGSNLSLLVNPDAQRVIQMMQTTPGIVDAALSTTDSPRAALQFLLAEDPNLSPEELDFLLTSRSSWRRNSLMRKPSAYETRGDNQAGLSNCDTGPCPPPPDPGNPSQKWCYDKDTNTCTMYSAAETKSAVPDKYTPAGAGRITMPLVMAQEYAKNVGSVKDIFLNPAQLYNDSSITNMSDSALAALVYAQVYQEEYWFKAYNWIHPYYKRGDDPTQLPYDVFNTNSLNTKRFLKYDPQLLGILQSLAEWRARTKEEGEKGNYRLSGLGFGMGNQTLRQTSDAVLWYWQYASRSENSIRYQTSIKVDKKNDLLPFYDKLERFGLWDYYAQDKIIDAVKLVEAGLVPEFQYADPVKLEQWNVLRFIWAGARQREGLGAMQGRDNDVARKVAIDYNKIAPAPSGRPKSQVSAFSLLTTIYSDDITVSSFAGAKYDAKTNTATAAGASNKTERNKAIRAVELLDSRNIEGSYRIQQPLGIKLTTQYAVDTSKVAAGPSGDFLPYNAEEAVSLVEALQDESQKGDRDSLKTLCCSNLLQDGYKQYTGKTINVSCQSVDCP